MGFVSGFKNRLLHIKYFDFGGNKTLEDFDKNLFGSI
jgi:hypothetical protein